MDADCVENLTEIIMKKMDVISLLQLYMKEMNEDDQDDD